MPMTGDKYGNLWKFQSQCHDAICKIVTATAGFQSHVTGENNRVCAFALCSRDRATDGLDLSRDLLASARDYSQAKIANDQNEVVKRLTVIASLLLVPTFIVGVYGQNFNHIPELSWAFGYWWSWGWIVFTTILQLAFFRWLGWIGGGQMRRLRVPPLQTLDPRSLRGRRRRPSST